MGNAPAAPSRTRRIIQRRRLRPADSSPRKKTEECSKPEIIFFDAYGTLFVGGNSPTPAEDLHRLLEADGVRAPLPLVRAALEQEMAYYRERQRWVGTREQLEDLRRECGQMIIDGIGGSAVFTLDPKRMGQLIVQAFPIRSFPDVVPALQAARAQGCRLGVLSNFSLLLPIILEDLALLDKFDLVVYSAESGVEKPDPAIFREALRQAGVPAARAAHIGDTYADDVAGARAAGMNPILLDRAGQVVGCDCPVARDLLEAVRLAAAAA